MAAKKTPARKLTAAKCKPCKGTGEVSRPVRVGRKHRVVGEQTGMCLACFGSGEAPTN
ncbi:hypothetical protein OG453_40510 [Streptomyces sp. NBC_01381]|uniref:hypothetical protein n=1 Tax=Streptomyces sp. NBC_01381 TaxID=2903845 RepID=UPI002259D77C|nr:hypothetical protein [Streptomyces sp. NBC_01381]MCX4672855.1 hypothetical protein [Streptomyces sp. NBC_01381]